MVFVREWRARRVDGSSTPVAPEGVKNWRYNQFDTGVPSVTCAPLRREGYHLRSKEAHLPGTENRNDLISETVTGNSSLRRFAFTKADRILKRSQFIAFRRSGRKVDSPFFFAVIQQNHLPHCRLGITVTRKVGKAAQRNRIKRRIREYFRLNRHRIEGNWDIHLIAKKGAGEIDFGQASSSLDRIFHQLGTRRKG